MNRAVLWGGALGLLLMGAAVLAQDRPTGEQAENRQVQRDRPQNLTPEERAKLREKWATMSPEERAKARAQMRGQLAENRPQAGTAPRGAADQIAALKQEHQAVMTELQTIRQMAVKEKATETTKALETLIARRQAEFQRRITQLEQRIQAAQKQGDSAPPKTDARQPAETKRQKNTGRQPQR